MQNLLSLLESAALRFPDKTAVACRDEHYSFSGCLDLASRLGRAVRDRMDAAGVTGGNHPVPVMVSRDAGTVVAFLAVLFSGNFYVALDPDMPREKLSRILAELSPSVILSSGGAPESLRDAGYTGPVLGLGDVSAEPLPLPDTSPEAPAYMIYTSGSTGVPKGVLKSHSAVLAFISSFSGHFGLGAEEIIGNQTPLFFDASAKDLYLMLFTGATLEILPSELFILPVTLIRYMNERKVTYISWVPSALAVVTQLNTFREVLPQTLRRVFFVGEVFPMKQLRKWMEALPELTYVNLYGSTEQAGICCWQEVDASLLEEDILPIGKPLPGCTVLLRGENGWITAPDETGEIYSAGPSLALEYYRDPEKTASAFPLMTLPDGSRQRMLATGDLARYDAEGRLRFVSRSDTQIKHMGRRIELGEIEAAAEKLPEILRCCCLYNDKKKQIVLFAETAPESAATGRELRSALKPLLAEYMVPAKVEVLEQLPQTPNGKIDRQKLKAGF